MQFIKTILILSCLWSFAACSTSSEDKTKAATTNSQEIKKATSAKSAKQVSYRSVAFEEDSILIIEPPITMSWKLKKYSVKDRPDLVYQEGFHYTGEKRSLGFYKNDRKHGVWLFWYPNGQKTGAYYYKDGSEHGIHQEWYENGQLKSEATYVDGARDKDYKTWYPNGQQWKITQFINGVPTGDYKEWHDNGNSMMEGQYNDLGQKHGDWKRYHADGKIKLIEVYENGVVKELKEENKEA